MGYCTNNILTIPWEAKLHDYLKAITKIHENSQKELNNVMKLLTPTTIIYEQLNTAK